MGFRSKTQWWACCLSAFCITLLAAGCGSAQTIRYDYSKEPDPRTSEFVIGAADKLQITVWKNPDLSGIHNVRPDGTITIPLLGDLIAAGRTPSALRKELGVRLAQYVRDEGAVVTIEVTEINSYRFTVSGEVRSPGMLRSNHYVTVSEAIMQAGGFTRFAKTRKINIFRCCNTAGKKRRIPIDFDAINTGRTDMNIVLLAGDEVHVP